MWKSIYGQIHDVALTMTNSIVWALSFLLGTFLTALGYPKEVLSFLFWLIIIDLMTKHYALVRAKYGTFTLGTYVQGWKDRVLTSRSLKDGIGVKAMLYTPILYVAHKLTVIKEVVFGESMSSILYSLLIVIEVISVLENFNDAGHRDVAPFLKLFKKKKKEIAPDEE